MTKAQKVAQEEARETLRKIVKPGDTLYTVLRHVSRSGMSRGIDVYALTCRDGVADRQWLSRFVSRAVGIPFDERKECLKVGGCGMDMGFHVVYELSHALYPEGFPVTETIRCPKCLDRPGYDGLGRPCGCDRGSITRPKMGRNGDMSGWDKDGGYALSHRWL